MDSRYLLSLLEVIRLGSIAEAARSLNLTPAAVGQRIKSLERDLNTDLLIRTGHKARPTEACEHLLPQMHEIVQKCRDLEFGWDPSGLSGILRVGAISTALTGLLSPAIKAVREKHPQTQIHLFPGSSKSLHRRVLDGDLDIAIIAAPPAEVEKTLVMEAHHEEPLVFISSDTTTRDPEQAMRSESFLAYDPSSWGGLVVQRYLDQTGIKINTISVLDSPEMIVSLVREGIGVSILPRWIGFRAQVGNVVQLELGHATQKRTISIIYRHDSPRRRKLEVFKSVLQQTQA